MANVYEVTASMVAAEVPGLMPTGFSASTKPAQTVVENWIATADLNVQLVIAIDVGTPPDISDKAAKLAQRYIINYTLANVMRAVYAGRQPQDVQAAAKPYADEAAAIMQSLVALNGAIVGDGSGNSGGRVRGSMSTRGLLVTDDQLDACRGPQRGPY